MIKLIITGMIAIFIISGCTAIGTGLKEYDLSFADEYFISKQLEKNYSELRSLSGRFDFAYSTAYEKKQSSGYLYISRKDTIYIEINGLVGETEAVLFMNKDSLKAVNYLNKLLVRGARDENSINRVTGMNIKVSDLKNSLLCYNTRGDSLNIVRKEPGKIILRIMLNEKEYQFVTLNENLLITEIDEYTERDLKYKKEYDYYTEVDGHIIPRRVRIRTFNPPTKLTIFYTDLNVNGKPKPFSEVSL